MPTFHRCTLAENEVVFTDLAALNDPNQPMIVRIFLALLTQKIFQDAARVKFIVPIPAEQAQSQRSQRILGLLEDI